MEYKVKGDRGGYEEQWRELLKGKERERAIRLQTKLNPAGMLSIGPVAKHNGFSM
jgi:hypothetical protein